MHGSPTTKINELREQGYKVGVRHRRPLEGAENKNKLWTRDEREKLDGDYQFAQTGGETEVMITNTTMSVTTLSVCSLQDNFNYNLGLRIALGRALKLLP